MEKFQDHLYETILPQIRKKGHYIPESFYKDNLITEYKDKNVLYLGYIGDYEGLQYYKFGKSGHMLERDYYQHRNNFEMFDLKYVIECDNINITAPIGISTNPYIATKSSNFIFNFHE